nr:PIN domain-containing protein [Streptomyces sp. NBC_00995]
MIILDTCTLRSAGLRSSSADLLRTISRSGADRIAVPWVAMEELAAQKAVDYLAAWETAIGALEALAKTSPWEVPSVGAADPEAVRKHWRQQWGDLVTVLPSSVTVMQEAMMREANALPPCRLKTDGSKNSKGVKIGGRDAAIWLTAVEYAREHPAETVYFVSENHKDFTDGVSGYPYPMDQDFEDIADRFVHLTSLSDLISRFATPTDVEMDRVEAACALPGVDDDIADDAFTRWNTGFGLHSPGFECTWATAEGSLTGWASGWLVPSDVKVRRMSLENVSAYRIGDHVWATADVSWELSGFTLVDADEQFVHAATRYDTRILASIQDEASDLSVLRGDRLRAVDYDIRERSVGKRLDRVRFQNALDALSSERTSLALDQVLSNVGDKTSSERLRALHRARNEQAHGISRNPVIARTRAESWPIISYEPPQDHRG